MPRMSHDATSSAVSAFAFPGRVGVRFVGLLGPEVKKLHLSIITQLVGIYQKSSFQLKFNSQPECVKITGGET